MRLFCTRCAHTSVCNVLAYTTEVHLSIASCVQLYVCRVFYGILLSRNLAICLPADFCKCSKGGPAPVTLFLAFEL